MAAKPAQELGLCDGQQMIPVELAALVEVIHQREAALDPVRHRDRDGPVELDHRRWMHACEHPVQGGNLPPIRVGGGGRLCVDRRDRRLQRIRTRRAASGAQRGFDDGRALVDLRVVPPRPVLILEQHDVPDPSRRVSRRESCSSMSASSPFVSA